MDCLILSVIAEIVFILMLRPSRNDLRSVPFWICTFGCIIAPIHILAVEIAILLVMFICFIIEKICD